MDCPCPTARLAAAMIAGLCIAAPAAAQMYKWVDERGGVTYSNAPPPNGAAHTKIVPVPERVSSYTPDAPLQRAIEAERQNELRFAQDPHGPAQRSQSSNIDPRHAAYARCVADRRVDCEAVRFGAAEAEAPVSTPYFLPVFVAGSARRSHRSPPIFFPQVSVPPRVGVDNRPPVGVDHRPPVGIDSRPRVGIDNRPPVGIDNRPPVGIDNRPAVGVDPWAAAVPVARPPATRGVRATASLPLR